jgi:hypothetical protein
MYHTRVTHSHTHVRHYRHTQHPQKNNNASQSYLLRTHLDQAAAVEGIPVHHSQGIDFVGAHETALLPSVTLESDDV